MRRLVIAIAFIAIYLWKDASTPYADDKHATNEAALRMANTTNTSNHRDGRISSEGTPFVVDEAMLDILKSHPPTIVRNNHENPYRTHPSNGIGNDDLVADVISIGSNSRPHYLAAQVETWSSHASIRNFWGFTENEDYDPECTSMSMERVEAHLQTCRTPHRGPRKDIPWNDADIETFAIHRYGETEAGLRHEAGWVCAQRRVGRALGWVHHRYSRYSQHNNHSTTLPDLLLLVDDDTSLDMSNLKRQTVDKVAGGGGAEQPLVYAGCAYPKTTKLDLATTGWPFSVPHGGFGTFFTRSAIEKLVRPIHCDTNENSRNNNDDDTIICANLKENKIGELQVFHDGISVLELFYRYSALTNFCLHSDWTVGYLINRYLYPQSGQPVLPRANPPLCGNVTDRGKNILCTSEYTACHRQTPKDMESLAITAFMKSQRHFGKIPTLEGTEFVMGNHVPKS